MIKPEDKISSVRSFAGSCCVFLALILSAITLFYNIFLVLLLIPSYVGIFAIILAIIALVLLKFSKLSKITLAISVVGLIGGIILGIIFFNPHGYP